MLVSIIVPVYNSSRFIADTIECILGQSYYNLEAIFVDNGSSDNSVEVINSFNDSRIKIFVESTKGACYARNLGYSKSTGEIIQYLDSDDLLSLNYIREKVDSFVLYGLDKVIFSRVAKFNDKLSSSITLSKKLEKNYQHGILMLIDMAKFQQPSQISSWTISRYLHDKAGMWNVSLLRNQDGEMLMRLLLSSRGTIYISNTQSYYRDSENSISKNTSQKVILSLFESFSSYEYNMLSYENSLRVINAIQQFYATLLLIPDALFIRNTVINRINSFEVKPILGGSVLVRYLSFLLGIRLISFLIIKIKQYRRSSFEK